MMTCEALDDLLLTDEDMSGQFELDELALLIGPEDIDCDFSAEI